MILETRSKPTKLTYKNMNDSNFSEIPNDAMVLLGKTGMTNELIDEMMSSISPDFSYRTHLTS
jgi:hypothetical protein